MMIPSRLRRLRFQTSFILSRKLEHFIGGKLLIWVLQTVRLRFMLFPVALSLRVVLPVVSSVVLKWVVVSAVQAIERRI